MSIKQWFRNWLLSQDSVEVAIKANHNPLEEEASQLTFSVVKATNGRIIKVSTYKPQQRGPDWMHELYIVKDDEKIPDVIGRIMAIKALER
jgi:hypothetical protein